MPSGGCLAAGGAGTAAVGAGAGAGTEDMGDW